MILKFLALALHCWSCTRLTTKHCDIPDGEQLLQGNQMLTFHAQVSVLSWRQYASIWFERSRLIFYWNARISLIISRSRYRFSRGFPKLFSVISYNWLKTSVWSLQPIQWFCVITSLKLMDATISWMNAPPDLTLRPNTANLQ